MTSQSAIGVAAIRTCKGVEICCCCLVCHSHCRTEDIDHWFYFSFWVDYHNLTIFCPTFFASLPCINLVSWHTTFEFSTAERKIPCECIMPVSSTFIIILSTHSNFCFYIKSNSFTFAHTTSSQTATRTTQITMEMR